ncbi:hypothetical protein ES708_31027 [subsurface metagenome]
MSDIWHIYHVQNCSHVSPPKNKYVAIVCRDLASMGFFINSSIHEYIQNRPDLLASQVVIEKSNHKCLSRDSYVNCIKLYPFEDTELVEDRGSISEQAMIRIKEAVDKSKTIEVRYKKLILGKV